MSECFSLLTTVAALDATTEMIGGAPHWQALSSNQRQLLERYETYRDALARVPSLQAWAKRSAQELNEILEARGFSIRLDPWPLNENLFGTLSINDITVLWPEAGNLAPEIDGHPAFSLGRAGLERCLRVRSHPHPIIRLRTRGDEFVCLSIHDAPGGQFELVAAVERLRAATVETEENYDRVVMPMVKLAQSVDVSWLSGLATASPSGPWAVGQACQEVLLAMNQHGARAKEATAVAMFRGLPKRYTIDQPFLFWIERPDLAVPIFSAYISREDWADPGDLSAL